MNQKSILSAQYNNVAITPGELAEIRGHGQFQTDGMSSNWPVDAPMGEPTTYLKDTTVFPSYGSKWDLSEIAPVGTKKNDQWDYNLSKSSFLGDPYTQFGLQANQSTPTAVNSLFFNRSNVKYLQRRILEEVEKLTGILIKPQSESALMIIMNNKYQYSLYGALPATSVVHLAMPRGEKSCSLRQRLSRLNQAVLQDAIKQIVSGINMYATYYKDASSIPIPLSHPELTSMKGNRALAQNIGLTSGNSRGISSYNMRNNIIN